MSRTPQSDVYGKGRSPDTYPSGCRVSHPKISFKKSTGFADEAQDTRHFVKSTLSRDTMLGCKSNCQPMVSDIIWRSLSGEIGFDKNRLAPASIPSLLSACLLLAVKNTIGVSLKLSFSRILLQS